MVLCTKNGLKIFCACITAYTCQNFSWYGAHLKISSIKENYRIKDGRLGYGLDLSIHG